MQDTALVLIETQREWFAPDGRLHPLIPPAALQEAHSALVRLLAAARAADLPIFHLHLSFEPGHSALGRAAFGLRHSMRAHDVWTGPGIAPAPGLEPHPGEPVLSRTGSSAFAGSSLDSVLRNNGIQRLIVGGLAAHVCVLSTVMQAHDLGYDVVVPREASAALSAAQHALVLDAIAPHFAWVKPLSATLDHLERRAGIAQAADRFLRALAGGDAAGLRELLDEDLVVEGALDGRWCRWDRATYLDRVARLGGQVRHAGIERLHLVGTSAALDTRVEVPGVIFRDHLSWSLQGGRWLLRHKSFLAQPAHPHPPHGEALHEPPRASG